MGYRKPFFLTDDGGRESGSKTWSVTCRPLHGLRQQRVVSSVDTVISQHLQTCTGKCNFSGVCVCIRVVLMN